MAPMISALAQSPGDQNGPKGGEGCRRRPGEPEVEHLQLIQEEQDPQRAHGEAGHEGDEIEASHRMASRHAVGGPGGPGSSRPNQSPSDGDVVMRTSPIPTSASTTSLEADGRTRGVSSTSRSSPP